MHPRPRRARGTGTHVVRGTRVVRRVSLAMSVALEVVEELRARERAELARFIVAEPPGEPGERAPHDDR